MLANIIIAAVAIVGYFMVAGLEMVRFVAEDMRHYWQQGSEYLDSDLSDAIVAGAVRGLCWPFTFLLMGARWLIHTGAYRLAARWWERHGHEPIEDTSTHMPRHSATA